MRVFWILLVIFVSLSSTCLAQDYTLSAGVSVDEVPQMFYGSWRITAKLEDTNSYVTFKPQSADLWHLYRNGDIITLENPFTGAKADISLKSVEGNLIVFSKKANYDNKILTDTVALRLEKNTFKGINTLSLESYSLIDNHLMKTETARYLITGEKISGENVIDK